MDCWCFPEEHVLRKEYREQLSVDAHLGEKTAPTIVEWLAGSNVKSYALVPFYAQSDYEEYLCTDSNQIVCRTTQMLKDIHISEIEKALRKIARPCECKKNQEDK